MKISVFCVECLGMEVMWFRVDFVGEVLFVRLYILLEEFEMLINKFFIFKGGCVFF